MIENQSNVLNTSQMDVIIWISSGMPSQINFEISVAIALMLRGIKVHAIVCDGSYRACFLRDIFQRIPIEQWNCKNCIKITTQLVNRFNLPYSYLSKYISQSTKDKLWKKASSFSWNTLHELYHDKIFIGKQVQSNILKFFKNCHLFSEDKYVQEFVFSGLIVAESSKNLIQQNKKCRIFMSDRCFSDGNYVASVASKFDVPMTVYTISKNVNYFHIYHLKTKKNSFSLLTEITENNIKNGKFIEYQQKRLDLYFETRYTNFHLDKNQHLSKSIENSFNYEKKTCSNDIQKPIFGILAYQIVDDIGFPISLSYNGFDDWLISTIKTIITIKNIDCIIFINSDEYDFYSARRINCLINNYFYELPKHIRIKNSVINKSDSYKNINIIMTICPIAGLELAALGKIVVFGGQTHYSKYGFIYSAKTSEEHNILLNKLSAREHLSSEKKLLAKKYAYLYFIQLRLPLFILANNKNKELCLSPDKLYLLMKQGDPFINLICERILDGNDVVMNESLLKLLYTNKQLQPKKETSKLYTERKKSNQYKGHNLIFVIGAPRSGNTWLKRLLSCHPKITSGQESNIIDLHIGQQLRMWRKLLDYRISGRPCGLVAFHTEKEFISILRQYMVDLLEPMIYSLNNGEYFVEQTPTHALWIPEIRELLPESKIIHIIRDPRDVVASLIAASKSWARHWAPKDAKSAANLWNKYILTVHHTSKIIPKKYFHELHYEDLSTQPETVLTKISQFLGIEWPYEDIRSALKENEISLAKKTGGTPIPVKGELSRFYGSVTIEPKGFIRKGRPGAWKEDLSDKEIFQIYSIAGKTMETLGYD